MWLHRTTILVVLAGLSCGASARAEVPLTTPSLTQAVGSGRLRFQVVSGQITILGSRVGNFSSSSTSSGGSDKLWIRVTGRKLWLTYNRSTAREHFAVEVSSDDRTAIHYEAKDDATIVPVRFTQAPDEPTRLEVGPDGQRQVYRAESLWHLLIEYPQESRRHLIPLLTPLRPGWRMTETATAMESELLSAAASNSLPDYRQWEAWVKQLADDRFSRREAADRRLRAEGQAVLGYLRQLDVARLDAEQQRRIQRIIKSLAQGDGEDTAEQFAPRLVYDAGIWLALLSREQESTRRLAARQLAAILGQPIDFDPTADAVARKAQIERLRTRVDAHASSKD